MFNGIYILSQDDGLYVNLFTWMAKINFLLLLNY